MRGRLTVGLLPFVYAFGLACAYENVFMRIGFVTNDRRVRRRTRFAVLAGFHVRARELGAFSGYWPQQAAEASSFAQARQVVRDFGGSRTAAERATQEKQARLKRYAGLEGTDDDGRRLDQRECEETKCALRRLQMAQMGWYRNQGGRYRSELADILASSFTGCGLPDDHGITLHVSRDGQSWWAWRRTVTGWCFAIGAAEPPSDEWLFDGPEPPRGFPGRDAAWGERWGLDARNWH